MDKSSIRARPDSAKRTREPMNRKANRWLRFRAVIVLLLIGACTDPPDVPLRIGSNQWPGYEPVYLARDRGWFDADAVRLVELNSASAVIEQIRMGQLDGGMLTLDEVLSLEAGGVAMKVVDLLDFSHGADVLIGRPGIELDGLRGRRIGVENTAVGAIMLDAALEAAGLGPRDVEIVPVEISEHLSAWLHGRLDALVTFEPVRSRLLARGGHVLFDSRRIPDRIIDVLAIRSEVIARQGPRIRKLLTAYERALDALKRSPRPSCEAMAPRLHIDAATLCRSYSGIEIPGRARSFEWLVSGRLEQRAAGLADRMYRHGLLPRKVSTQGLAEPRFLRP